MLRGKFIAVRPLLKKQKYSNQYPSLSPEETRIKGKVIHKANIGKEIVKIRTEIDKLESRKATEEIKETKVGLRNSKPTSTDGYV